LPPLLAAAKAMFGSFFIAAVVLLLVAIGGGYLYVRGRARERKIAELLSGMDLLARWTYTGDEWRKAVAEEFTWARHGEGSGTIFIWTRGIYVRSAGGDRIFDLSGGGRVVTYAAYRGAEGSLLKLRVRWRVVEQYADRPDEVKYYKEDYRIPVPLEHREAAQRVVEYFTAQAQNNPDAYATVMPDDEPLSLFGKDSF
jgi:hypothetical protein